MEFTKLNNRAIINLEEGLSKLLEENKAIKASVAFKLAHNYRLVNPLKEEIMTARMAIVQRYGELQEDDASYVVPQDRLAQANAELDDLLSVEVSLPLVKITLDELEEAEIGPLTMNRIYEIIDARPEE